MFHAAAEARGDDDGALRAAAERAAEQVWERGLLLKGLSLCHGLAGNAYAFLALARWTGDDVQLARAHAFAAMMGDERYLQLIAQQDDPQRRVRGVPDSPASLMEGTAGVAARAPRVGWDCSRYTYLRRSCMRTEVALTLSGAPCPRPSSA